MTEDSVKKKEAKKVENEAKLEEIKKIYNTRDVYTPPPDSGEFISINELGEILSTTIKHDEINKKITFLGMLLTYTEEDQVNIGFFAESSTGKSYIPIEISQYFPQEDVISLGYASPTSFFHEAEGIWDKERSTKIIDWRKKVIIFLDQPHDMLLQRLRSLLSHDKRIVSVKITDRSKRALRTKNIDIIGFPTVIFCTARPSIEEQEKTRLLLLSPEVAEEKIRKTLELLAERLKDRESFRKLMWSNSKRLKLVSRVYAIKNAKISDIIIKDEDMNFLLEKFFNEHPYLIPRHQRDFPKLIAIIKAVALLNFHVKERLGDKIIATREDVEEGYNLYKKISEANELGLSPEIYEIYKKVFTNLDSTEGLTKRDISKEYFKVFHRPIGQRRLNLVLETLLSTGLIEEGYDPVDRRLKRYFCVQTEGVYTSQVLYISGEQTGTDRLLEVKQEQKFDDFEKITAAELLSWLSQFGEVGVSLATFARTLNEIDSNQERAVKVAKELEKQGYLRVDSNKMWVYILPKKFEGVP